MTPAPEVFGAREIALAVGVSTADIRRLLARGELDVIGGRFVRPADAIRVVRTLRRRRLEPRPDDLFRPAPRAQRSRGGALAVSGAIHTALLAGIILVSMMGLSRAREMPRLDPLRLIFLPIPGPGGGGGGGGLKQPDPPPKAELKGEAVLRSPVPPQRPITSRPPERRPVTPPPPPQPTLRPIDPPPAPKPEVTPQVVAPVATLPADTRDKAGVISESASRAESNGPGTGTGAGTGKGSGLGEGEGSGIGPGNGGGTGGGPYRPGSGIIPPRLLREVKPDYTEDARRRGVAGDVVLEIVVRRDGSVGEVKLLQGLGAGLDQRAIEAVRAWRFSPAERFGTPVDVIVEVAVEFKLR